MTKFETAPYTPAYQSEVDAMTENGMSVDDAPTTPIELKSEDPEKGLSREEVVTALRRLAAAGALGLTVASLGSMGYLSYEAHELRTAPTETVHYDNTTETAAEGHQYNLARANELVNMRNKIIPLALGAAAIGGSLMGSRKEE